MRNNYDEAAQGDFGKAYLMALQAIIRFNEELAGTRLNRLRDLMEPFKKPYPIIGHILPQGSAAERAIFTELDDNKVLERGALYGDYKSNEKTPWVKDPVLLGMIKSHVELLGSDDDKEKLKDFLAKTEAFYGAEAKPASSAQQLLALV